VAVLRAHRTRQNEERLRLGDLWQDHNLVFPNRVGKPLDHGNLYDREYKLLLQRAGLGDEGFTFHSLRHTFATELFNQRKRPKFPCVAVRCRIGIDKPIPLLAVAHRFCVLRS
jgi:integrase